MAWFKKKTDAVATGDGRRSPSLASVEQEAAAFRAESRALREELGFLRTEIHTTIASVEDFTKSMKEKL